MQRYQVSIEVCSLEALCLKPPPIQFNSASFSARILFEELSCVGSLVINLIAAVMRCDVLY